MSRPAALDYETTGVERIDATRLGVPRRIGTAAVRGVVTVAIAVWLGSLFHLLLTVATLFAAFPKAISDVAVQAAPAVFKASERVTLIVAALALASSVAWVWHAPSRSRRWIAWLLTAAAILAVVQTTLISARMDRLREAGQSGSDAFRTLHGASSVQYLTQTALLLLATALLPAALRDADALP